MHPQYTPDEVERFWSRVDKSGDCWLWTGGLARKGYGHLRWHRRDLAAHRVAWELTHGSIPDGLWVLHSCPGGGNPRCVRPEHLYLGTAMDNARDTWTVGRGPRGDEHHARQDPGSVARGDAHWTRRRPDLRPYGERSGVARLTASQVLEIRRRYTGKRGELTALAREYGVHIFTITCVVRRRTWQHL